MTDMFAVWAAPPIQNFMASLHHFYLIWKAYESQTTGLSGHNALVSWFLWRWNRAWAQLVRSSRYLGYRRHFQAKIYVFQFLEAAELWSRGKNELLSGHRSRDHRIRIHEQSGSSHWYFLQPVKWSFLSLILIETHFSRSYAWLLPCCPHWDGNDSACQCCAWSRKPSPFGRGWVQRPRFWTN